MGNNIIIALGSTIVLAVVYMAWRTNKKKAPTGATQLPFEARFEQFLRQKAVSFITLALITNTFLAQLYVRSDGLIIFSQIRAGYVIFSAIGSTVAFSIFEVLQVRTLNEMLNDGLAHGKGEWVKNIGASLFVSLYNFYSIAILDYALSPDRHTSPMIVPQVQEIPFPIWITAAGFTAILFLVSLVGERKLSPEQEVKRVQDDAQRQLLSIVNLELSSVISGKQKPSKAFVALSAIGGDVSKVFFANFVAALNGSITMDDVLASSNLKGVIKPAAATKNASFEEAESVDDGMELEGESNPILSRGETSPDGLSAVNEVTSDDAEFEQFELEGITLTDELPISTMAKRLGTPQSTLNRLWDEYNMPYRRGANNAKLIAVYHVLALVNRRLLAMPDRVKVREAIAL